MDRGIDPADSESVSRSREELDLQARRHRGEEFSQDTDDLIAPAPDMAKRGVLEDSVLGKELLEVVELACRDGAPVRLENRAYFVRRHLTMLRCKRKQAYHSGAERGAMPR